MELRVSIMVGECATKSIIIGGIHLGNISWRRYAAGTYDSTVTFPQIPGTPHLITVMYCTKWNRSDSR